MHLQGIAVLPIISRKKPPNSSRDHKIRDNLQKSPYFGDRHTVLEIDRRRRDKTFDSVTVPKLSFASVFGVQFISLPTCQTRSMPWEGHVLYPSDRCLHGMCRVEYCSALYELSSFSNVRKLPLRSLLCAWHGSWKT